MTIKRITLNVLGWLCLLLLTVSCTKHPEQYSRSPIEEPVLNLSSKETPSNESSKVIEKSNSFLAYENLNSQNPQDSYRKIRQNSSLPINYENQSAGGIDINHNAKSVFSILHPDQIAEGEDNTLRVSYKEGLIVRSKEEEITSILIDKTYKGFLNFGPQVGKKRVGDSFANQFDLNSHIQKDLKNKSFIRSLYNHLEKTNVDCFRLNQCKNYFVDQIFVVELPKMRLVFGTDERRTLLNIGFIKKEDDSEDTLAHINYQNRSIGDNEPVEWKENVFALLDFGSQIGVRKPLDSFSDVIDLTAIHPERDQGVQIFIISLYNHLEEAEINCLQENLCHMEVSNSDVVFKFPKMELAFSKNNLAVLENISIIGKKYEKHLKNKRYPYNYREDSIANIHLQMKREEVEEILNSDHSVDIEEKMTFYPEGLQIKWGENDEIVTIKAISKQTFKNIINATTEEEDKIAEEATYKGAFNFGLNIGSRTLGQSFLDQFNLNQANPKEDQKAKDFIVSLYNSWEQANTNCLETKDCEIIVQEESIQFSLPKINLFFSNDYQRNFTKFILNGSEIQKREKQTRDNIKQPINLLEQSIANINIQMTRDEIEEKLYLLTVTPNNLFIYKEGLAIVWNENNTPEFIIVQPDYFKSLEFADQIFVEYQGALDFGPEIGSRILGQSFLNQFNLNQANPKEDQKAKDFIASLYNSWEQANTNCLETKDCEIIVHEKSIQFSLPKINLFFSNDSQRKFTQFVLKGLEFQKREKQTRENIKQPINLLEQSIANINMQMTRDEIEEKLLLIATVNNLFIYKEGLAIVWNENNTPEFIIVNPDYFKSLEFADQIFVEYQGALDFGPEIGSRILGQSFLNQFNLNQANPKEDQKAKDFIVSLYNSWEQANTNCLETKDCEIIVHEKNIQFSLPKINLFFSNDYQRNFTRFVLKGLEFQKREKQTRERQRRERQTRENIKQPINFLEQSIANINIQMTRDEIEEKLFLIAIADNLFIYREGLAIEWNENNNKPKFIVVDPDYFKNLDKNLSNYLLDYQGAFDFGPELGPKHAGTSFKDQFDLNSQDLLQDEKAKNFISSIYNYLNNTEINCLEMKKCGIGYTLHTDRIVFQLPTLELHFTNDTNRNLVSVVLINPAD